MTVMDYIKKRLEYGKMHMGLIDPVEQDAETVSRIASILKEAGSDAIMVGGSTGIEQYNVDSTVQAIKSTVDLPVILFPTDARSISRYADAIYFMSMLNSRDIRKIVGEQVIGAPIVREMGIEPLSMAYLIVEPGMTVGRVGDAKLIPRDDPNTAVNYGLAAKYLGMELIYLEAGSGAPEPVSDVVISAVKEQIDLPLIVGGGIRTAEQAKRVSEAGADIIVTGTIIEESRGVKKTIEGLVSAIKD